MRVKHVLNSPTEAQITVVLEENELTPVKKRVLMSFQSEVSFPGFRRGKAPLEIIEKSVDPAKLQSTFLEDAINQSYPQAIKQTEFRPVDRPEISIKKFVPFNTLEYDAKVAVISGIKIPDYTKIKKIRPLVSVTAKEVNEVLGSLQQRLAEKVDVDRPSHKGDQVWIDFKGYNEKNEPIKGADGNNYPLILGSGTFIPGFEENLIGLKHGDTKTFTLTFPKDYGLKALAGKKVKFDAVVIKVQSIDLPKLDDTFAAKAGPFKSLDDLKKDIKKHLKEEKQHKAELQYESELVREISAKTKFEIPEILINDQIDLMVRDLKQNLLYRGQTLQEFLDVEGVDESTYRKNELRPKAEERVRASIVIAEIADKEKITVSPEELEIRLQAMKSQYSDPAMLSELEKPEIRQNIASRMLSEKTVAHIANTLNK